MQKKHFFLFFILLCYSTLGIANGNNTVEKLFEKAYVSLIHNDYLQALTFFEKLIVEENKSKKLRKYKLAEIHRYKALCYEKMFVLNKAIIENQISYDIYAQLNDSAKIASTLEKLGLLFQKQGKPEQALMFLNEALSFYHKTDWHSKLQSVYLNIGILQYYSGKYNSSIENIKIALQIVKQSAVAFDNSYIEPEAYYYMANSAFAIGKYNEAFQNITIAENHCRFNVNQLKLFYKQWIDVKLLKAKIHLEKNEFHEAEKEILKAEKMVGENKLFLSEDLIFIAKTNLFSQAGKHDQSESLINLWLTKTGYFSNSFPGSAYLNNCIEVVCNHYRLQYENTGSVIYLQKKMQILEHYFLTKFSNNLVFSFLRDAAYSEEKNSNINEETINCYFQMYESTKDSRYLEKAFDFSEQLNIGIINNELELGANSGTSSEGNNSWQKTAQLKSKINKELTIIYKNQNSEPIIKKRLITLIRKLEKVQNSENSVLLTKQIEKKQYLKKLQSQLMVDESYLKFYESEKYVYQFLVTKEKIKARQFSKDKTFQKNLTIYNSSIENPVNNFTINDANDFVTSAFYLFEKLIKPFQKDFTEKDLIIDQSGLFKKISFDALLTTIVRPVSLDMRNYPFLINNLNIKYSGSVLLYLKGSDVLPQKKDQFYSGFAPFAINTTNTKINNLPSSGLEVKEIAKLVDGEYYLGKEASKEAILGIGSHSRILHLATHAKNHTIHPQISELILNSEKASEKYLYYYEILKNHWKTDMLLLGACGSGNGEHFVNYGRASLSNAFQLAGVKSVVGANWQVNDFVSTTILTDMIQNIKNGFEGSKALRKAKINFIGNTNDLFTHPHFWSVYSYQGTDFKMNMKKSKLLYLWISFAVLLIFLAYFFTKFLSRSKMLR